MPEEKRPLRVFLCHAKADKQKVRELYRYLLRRRIKPWFDEVDLVGGQDWQVEIPKALVTSDAIIVCLTKNSVDKEGYIQKEIKFALDKALEMPEGRIFLIPVRFEECEVPFSLSRYQWVDLFDEEGYTKMMKSLKLRASQLKRATVKLSTTTSTEENLVPEEVAPKKSEREITEKHVHEESDYESAEITLQKKVEIESANGPEIIEETSAQKSYKSVVEMQGIVKRFPGVLANDHVDFELRPGEIHALLGENGAGKSTLMNVLAGLYKQDAGIIKVKGTPVEFASPRDAIRSGIGMVHQHFMLVPSQTVTENILLGLAEPRFLMRLNEYDAKIAQLGERFGLKVDPRAKIWQLSVGEQQRVELLKMLYRGANVLIMDEPTAVLAPTEIEGLFQTLRAMIAQGKSVIFISHKLHEVTAIADRVTVLRRGKVTAAGVTTQGVTRQELARLMVGREVIFSIDKKPKQSGEIILDVKDIHAENDKGLPALRGVSLNVRAGEIVGLAGVAGNGQNELSQVITGLRKCKQGDVRLNGDKVSNRDILYGIQHGMSYVPEDRTHVGSAPNLSVTDNVIMKKYRKPPISRGSLLDMTAATNFARELKQAYDIIVPTVNTPVRLLSGGNLQRVILAREISGQPNFMVAVQPTRGLDVGAIEGVHRLLLTQREADAAVLLISEELEELLSLSDRVYVIYEGKIMGEVKVSAGEPDPSLIETIGLMMTGTPLEQIRKEGVAAHG